MKISPQLKSDAEKLLLITIWYILVGAFMAAYNHALLHSPRSLGPSEQFGSHHNITVSLITGTIAGILGGIMLLVINGKLFRKRSFRFSMLVTGVSYMAIFSLAIMVNVAVTLKFWMGGNVSMEYLFWQTLEMASRETLITYFVLWGAVTLLTLFMLKVSDKFGPGVLIKFIMGKYHLPRKEDRIFMFLDMRSSTRVAEKLGNENYFSLLSDTFSDVTRTIIDNEGEIYQYVGDEIVISWPIKKGQDNSNCIRCFLEIREVLKQLAPEYLEKYGHAPEFKAGLHHGQVIAGEIGVIKRDIVYSGDVLNTTARIQEQCNIYNVDLLISDSIFEIIDNSIFEPISLGSILLRGKECNVTLNTVKLCLPIKTSSP